MPFLLHGCPRSRLHRAAVAVAAAFGLLTIFAGGRVLLGADPGYTVYRPLLVFNTLMGVAYLAAAVVAHGSLERGRRAAGAIVLLNLAVLGLVAADRLTGGPVAAESARAMMIRAAVWIAIFAALAWVGRANTGKPVPEPEGTAHP